MDGDHFLEMIDIRITANSRAHAHHGKYVNTSIRIPMALPFTGILPPSSRTRSHEGSCSSRDEARRSGIWSGFHRMKQRLPVLLNACLVYLDRWRDHVRGR